MTFSRDSALPGYLIRILPYMALLGCLSSMIVGSDEMALLRERSADLVMRLDPRPLSDAPVTLVEIDDRTLAEYGQWPLPRDLLANGITRISEAGGAIAVTILATEPDRQSPAELARRWPELAAIPEISGLPDTDIQLADALSGSLAIGPLLLLPGGNDQPSVRAGFAETGDDPRAYLPSPGGAVANIPPVEQAYAGLGVINAAPDTDGVIRYLPTLFVAGKTLVPAFGTEILRVVQDASAIVVKATGASGEGAFGNQGIVAVKVGAIEIPTDRSGRVRYVPPGIGKIDRISFADLLAGHVAPERLEGRIAVLGVTASGIADRFTTPVGASLTAAELQTEAIEQLLSGYFPGRPDWAPGAELVATLVAGSLVLFLCTKAGAGWAAIAGAAAAFAMFAGWLTAYYRFALLLDPVLPLFTVVVVFLTATVSQRWLAERRAGWIRRAFASYVSPNLVEALAADPGRLKLGGERKVLSFVFTDLAGFTSIVEKLDPAELPPLLSGYLDGMTRVAFDHGGTIDKFVGDAVHVIFGAPVDQPDHAARAVACAGDMQRFAQRYVAGQAERGVTLGETRIGVNSGPVVIGNFGGEAMFDFTAHGDAINTAARLESVNKQFGTLVCISENTAAMTPGFIGRRIGRLVLKGKTEPLLAYEPMLEGSTLPAEWQAYEAAYSAMEAGLPEAGDQFARLAEDHPGDSLAAYHRDRLASGETGDILRLSEK